MRAQYEWNIYGRSSIIDHRSLSSRVEYFFRYIHGKFVNLSFVGVGSWQEKCVFIVCTSYVNKLSCAELRARASSTGSWSVTPPVPGTGTPMVAAASVAPVQRLRQRFFSSSSIATTGELDAVSCQVSTIRGTSVKVWCVSLGNQRPLYLHELEV